MYMEGTKFEMLYFKNPDDMHRRAMWMGIALTWHAEGDPVGDPEHYTESFDVRDRDSPTNDRTGLSRRDCEEHIYSIIAEEEGR